MALNNPKSPVIAGQALPTRVESYTETVSAFVSAQASFDTAGPRDGDAHQITHCSKESTASLRPDDSISVRSGRRGSLSSTRLHSRQRCEAAGMEMDIFRLCAFDQP